MERGNILMDDIVFLVCQTPEEYEKCSEFQERIDGSREVLGFPTVYGLDHYGNLLGFVSTNTDYGCIQVISLVVDPALKPRYAYAKALIDALGVILQRFGVTEYLFSIAKDNDRMFQATSAQGLTPYGQDEQFYWYRRVLVKE